MERKNIIKNITAILFWAALLLICLAYKDSVTVEKIVNFTPDNKLVAALAVFLMFAIKGATVFIYGGILFIAVGIIFPLPLAIVVNTAGIAIMTTVPYFIGKKSGIKLKQVLIKKYPRLEAVLDIKSTNEFLTVFIVRLIGILPSDIVGMYFGVSGIGYVRYICGSVAGLTPTALLYAVMGSSVNDITSPAFIISAVFQIILIAISFVITYKLHRKKKQKAT